LVAEFMYGLGRFLIIEFVPKEDPQVKRLLSTREDIFPNYNQYSFERAFEKNYHIKNRVNLSGSYRTLYLMERR